MDKEKYLAGAFLFLVASCGGEGGADENDQLIASGANDRASVFVEPASIDNTGGQAIEPAIVKSLIVEGAVNGLAFVGESEGLAVALNREVLLLDATSGEERLRFTPCRTCNSVRINRSEDGREILMRGLARDTGAAYDAHSGEKLRDLTGPDYRASYAPEGDIALSVMDAEAGLEDAVTGEAVWTSGIGKIGALGFSPDGSQFVISADGDGSPRAGGKVLFYDAKTRDLNTQIEFAPGSFNHLAFSPDGKHLILGSYKARVIVWDMDQQTVHCRFDSDTTGQGLRALKVSPDGRLIATGGGSDNWGYARVWDSGSCNLRAETTFRDRVSGLSFHRTQPLLAAGAWSGEIALIDLQGVEK